VPDSDKNIFSVKRIPVSHFTALLLALLITFLWSTSYIIIKLGLKEIPPLVFAGMRYSIAFLVLLPFVFKKENILIIKNLKRREWVSLLTLGIIFYTFTQGAQFIGLSLLPSVTVSLLLNMTPLVVAGAAVFMLNEILTPVQRTGIALFLAGILIYFYPLQFSARYTTGVLIMLAAVLANAYSAILGRKINREMKIKPLLVTVISMGFGSLLLLVISLSEQSLPPLNPVSLLYILWMAIINTAFAFVIWNFTQRTLTAAESSVINGTMLFQITVLAWIFIGEEISLKEITGILIALSGIIIFYLKPKKNYFVT